MSQAASVLVIVAVLARHGFLFLKETDTQIIHRFVELSWQRQQLRDERQAVLDWACWCKAGMQLGEFTICPWR